MSASALKKGKKLALMIQTMFLLVWPSSLASGCNDGWTISNKNNRWRITDGKYTNNILKASDFPCNSNSCRVMGTQYLYYRLPDSSSRISTGGAFGRHYCGDYTITESGTSSFTSSPFEINPETGDIVQKVCQAWPVDGIITYSFKVDVKMANSPTVRTMDIEYTILGGCDSTTCNKDTPSLIYETPTNLDVILQDKKYTSVAPFKLISHYLTECNDKFENELQSEHNDSNLSITKKTDSSGEFLIRVKSTITATRTETVTLSFKQIDSGDVLISQQFIVTIDMSCTIDLEDLDYGELWTDAVDVALFEPKNANDLIFVLLTTTVAQQECFVKFELTSQEKYTQASEKTPVTTWSIYSENLKGKIRLTDSSTGPDVADKGVYLLKFTATTGQDGDSKGVQKATFTLKIIHEDLCYSVPQDLQDTIGFTMPLITINKFDEPITKQLTAYNLNDDFGNICSVFEITSTTPSHEDYPLVLLPISAISQDVPTSQLVVTFDQVPSYRENGNKPAGNYLFKIILSFAGKTVSFDNTIVLKDRCDDDQLSMTLSANCLRTQPQVSIQYNIRHEFYFSPYDCKVTYAPQDCHDDAVSRQILVEFETEYNTMFAQVDSSDNETPLVTTGTYISGNKFSAKIVVVDPHLQSTKNLNFKIQYEFKSLEEHVVFPIEVKPCLCSKWKLNNPKAEELIYLTEKDLIFNDPVCIDIAECQKGPLEWRIEFQDVTQGQVLASPTSLSPDFFTSELLPTTSLKMKQILNAIEDTSFKVNVAYKYYHDNGLEDQSLEQAETFEVTFKPCWCSEYAIIEISDVLHTFDEPAIEVNISEPSCTGESSRCLVARKFTYNALQADGSALPDGLAFDAETMIFSVNQLINSAEAKTIDVVIKVDTEETIITPIEVKFKIMLEAAIFQSITVEPSLSKTYEMSFNDNFEQLFTFKSQSWDDAPTIKPWSHPFITIEVGTADVLIRIDGPAALKYSKASENKTESVKIEVNGQIYKFIIKLLLPAPAEDKNENEENVQSKFAALLMAEKPNPIAKLYNFVPKTAEERAQVKISAAVSYIAKNGAISIGYDPPVAAVPKAWNKYFDQVELNKLSPNEREDQEKQAKKLLHITFVKNSEEQEQSHFVANLTQFTPEGIQIRLNFSDPLLVSQGDQPDQVRIKLLKDFFLNASQQNLLRDLASVPSYDDSEYFIFTEELPLLVASQEEYETLQDQVTSAKDAITAQFFGSFFVQLFLSGALSMLWNIFNTLQIILALNLFMVAFPANIKYFQEQIQDLINLEIFPTDEVYDNILVPVLNLETREQKKQRAMERATQNAENQMEPASRGLSEKFSGSSIIMNVLTVLLALTLFILVVGLVLVCKFTVLPRCCGCFKNMMMKLERKLFWNSLLRAFLEMYLSTSIFFFHQMGSIDTNNNEGRIEYLTWLVTGCFLFVFPYVIFRTLFTRWKTIHKREVRERYDSLYQSVDVYKGPIAFSFSFYFCLRRLAFAFVIGQVYRTIVFQIYLADMTSTLMLAYFICILPMEDRVNNAIQIFNELVVLTCIQALFLFTNYVESPEVRYKMGQKVLYLVAINIIINLVILVVITARKIYRAIRNSYNKRQLAKARRLKVEAVLVKASKKASRERNGGVKQMVKQTNPEGGRLKRKLITDFIDINEHSDEMIRESENQEIQSKPYESEEYSDDLSWHSAYSDESSSDEEEVNQFPSRAQIKAFSDSEFKSQARFLQRQYGENENEMLVRENIQVMQQFLTYQKFIVLGYKFCTLRRKAAIQTQKFTEDKEEPHFINRPLQAVAQDSGAVTQDITRQNSMNCTAAIKFNKNCDKIVLKYHEKYRTSDEAGSEEAKLPSIDYLSMQIDSIIGPQASEIQAEGQLEVVDQKQQNVKYEEAKVNRIQLQNKRKGRYLRNLLLLQDNEEEDCD